jgi:hypothetical protein
MRQMIQDFRKRWARRRSRSLAPNKEQELDRVRTPPKVLDPRSKRGLKM